MGKRPLVRRRGRGGLQFRATDRKISKARYPSYSLSEQHEGTIIDIIHERGRDVPLAKVRFQNNMNSFIPAILGTKVNSKIQYGLNSNIIRGNIISIQNIPDGTNICNIEKNFGDGGTIAKSAGTSAIVFSHGSNGVTIKLPSGKFH